MQAGTQAGGDRGYPRPFCLHGQCVADFEKRFITTTPDTISVIPATAAASSFWPWNIHAARLISTIPTPDQIA